jgi:ribosomal protein S18 acetylase RimI-like enzyme
MTDIQIRIATLADLDGVAALFDAYRQFYKQESDLSLARDFIHERMQREQSVILVAVTGDQQAIGFCQLYPLYCSITAKPIYSLSDLFVVSSVRRSGAGKALLQAAAKYAAEHRRVKMELITAKDNTTAQAAYESLGWKRDDVFYMYSKHIDDV